MESTIDRAEEKSDYEEYFGDMMVQEYAEKVEDQGGLGLAQQLYESMKRNEGDITLS
jgi:flagellar protein FlgJ